MKSRGDMLSVFEIASDESDVIDFCIIIFESDDLERAELRRQVSACEYFERERRCLTHEINSKDYFEYIPFQNSRNAVGRSNRSHHFFKCFYIACMRCG